MSTQTNVGEGSSSGATREEEPFSETQRAWLQKLFQTQTDAVLQAVVSLPQLATTTVPSSVAVSHGGVQSTVTQAGSMAVTTVSTSTVTSLSGSSAAISLGEPHYVTNTYGVMKLA